MANVRRSCSFAVDISRRRDSVKNLLKSIQVFLILIIEWEPITLCEMCEKCSNKANEHELMNSLWLELRRKALNFLTSKVSVPHWLEACKRFQVTITRSSRSTTAPLSGQCELVGVGRKTLISRENPFHSLGGFSLPSADWTKVSLRTMNMLSFGLTQWWLIACEGEKERTKKVGRSKKRSNLQSQIENTSQNRKLYWIDSIKSREEVHHFCRFAMIS